MQLASLRIVERGKGGAGRNRPALPHRPGRTPVSVFVSDG